MTERFATVALPLPLASSYTYRIPETLGDRVAPGARVVVPSAGPPCFLDPDLFDLNVIDGDELAQRLRDELVRGRNARPP